MGKVTFKKCLKDEDVPQLMAGPISILFGNNLIVHQKEPVKLDRDEVSNQAKGFGHDENQEDCDDKK